MACYILRNARHRPGGAGADSTYMTIVFDGHPGTFVAFSRRRDAYTFADVCEPKALVEKIPRRLFERACRQANARYCVFNPRGNVLNGYFEETLLDKDEQIACLEGLWRAS